MSPVLLSELRAYAIWMRMRDGLNPAPAEPATQAPAGGAQPQRD